jgi:uncharacterized membrane protein YbhN (UPF0104 family)
VSGEGAPAATAGTSQQRRSPHHRAQLALRDAEGHLKRSALKLAGYLALAYLVLKLIPSLKQALHSLEHVSWEWVVGAIALEVLSESGFVMAWRTIVDPDRVLEAEDRGRHMDERVAWAQLGGGLLLPGGSYGALGVGAWLLHRFGMPSKVVAEREFNLSFLNTTIDALAVIVFGLGLAVGIFTGENNLLLTAVPAGVAAGLLLLAGALARRAGARGKRLQASHPKISSALTTLSDAVEDTGQLVFHRGGWRSVAGVVAYLGFDVLVLYSAFLAVHAHPLPGFAVVVLAYIIGALGGSIPLPASLGTVGGMVGMLIVYRVGHNAAVAVVLLHQAIGLLVPLTGGGISYAVLRHRFGPLRATDDESPAKPEG